MKKTALINLICSLVAAVVVILGVLLAIIMTDGAGVEKKHLVISSASATAVYNGEPLFDDDWFLTEGELNEGHVLDVEVTGSQTHVGISENFVSAKIFDRNGADVTEDYYKIEYKPGALNVRPRDICLVAGSAMKAYDGTPLTCKSFTVESTVSLLPTDTIEVTVDGSITEVGTVKNRITAVKIFNDELKDVTRNYSIASKEGKLVVYDDDTLVIKTDDDMKYYDGTSLQNSNWTLENGKLMKDHVIEVNVTGTQTNVGESENSFTATVLDEHGNDVTHLYKIITVPGLLTVFPMEVTVTSENASKKYDGTPLTQPMFVTSPAHFSKETFRFVPNITGFQTQVGSSQNLIDSCVIYDSNNEDATGNFKISYKYGTLTVTAKTVTKEKLTVKSASYEKTYDREAISNDNWELSSGTVQDGHSIKVNFIKESVNGENPEITVIPYVDAGHYPNSFEVTVLDSNGENVTSQYDIEKEFGELIINPIEVTVTSKNAQKVYDGIPLTNPSYEVSPEHLLDTYKFECKIIGERVTVGASENTISSCKVYDSDDNDITRNFSVTKTEGSLIVVSSEEDILTEISYSSGNAVKAYDGLPLSNDRWVRTHGALKPGHTENVEITTSITEVGKVDNVFTVKITDASGADVTDEYLITSNYGTLEIYPRRITVASKSDQKSYDGTPLVNPEYTVRNTDEDDPSSPLANGDTLTADVIGSLTDPGKVENTISTVTIINSDGKDVTHCYDIDREYGFLVVTVDGSDGISSGDGDGSGSGEEGGTDGSGSGGESGTESDKLDLSGNISSGNLISSDSSSSEPLFLITSNTKGSIYLKKMSFGAYHGKGWASATAYTPLIDNYASAHYLTSYALAGSGMTPASVKIVSKKGEYVLPYYSMEDKQIQTLDTYVSGETGSEYTVPYFVWNYEGGISVPIGIRQYESDYFTFVKNQYLQIDTETNTFMQTVITDNGLNANDPKIIEKVAAYIQNAAEYSLDYDKTLDEKSNIVIAFLSEYKSGICQHYASAATMLFRALGIPARYTIGYTVDIEADTETKVVPGMAHAWVEVYIEGLGWINVEVTGGGNGSGNGGEGGGGNGGEGGSGNGGGGGGEGGSGSGGGGGGTIGGEIGNGGAQPTGATMFEVTSTINDTIYLKALSFGNYNPATNRWNAAPEYDIPVTAGQSAYYLPSLALDNSGATPYTLTVNPVGGIFALPYYSFNGSFPVQSSDTVMSGDVSASYVVNYFNWDNTAGIQIPKRLTPYENEYAAFVRENYLGIDSETDAFMKDIIRDRNFSISDTNIINKVAKYISTAADYDANYDTALDESSNVIIAFLSEYKTGICEHYAAAATLLYRSLGIPARYTAGFKETVSANTQTNITDASGHAWVEVYVDMIGWVVVEVTGSAEPTTYKLNLAPTSKSYRFDGTEHNAPQTVTGFDSLKADGYSYEAVISGSRTELGKSQTTIESFIIKDSSGTVVYDKNAGIGADKFLITYNKGTLQVYLTELVFKSISHEKIYDGTALSGVLSDISLVGNAIPDGYTYELTPTATITNAGKIANSFKVEIFKNGVSANDHFAITRSYGDLTVNALGLTVTAGSDEKVYVIGGAALTCNEITYDASALADGDRVESFTVIGSQTEIGESANIVREIVITNSAGKDVTSNYSITFIDGVLKVTES